MYKHHEETIENITEKLKNREDVLGVLIGGSIAHGFEREDSDVDIMIIVSDEDYKIKLKEGNIHYYEEESCTYKGGYIDGKYICLDFMNKVMEKGTEPARFAFEGAYIAFSKVDGLEDLINNIIKYPVERKDQNIRSFIAQFQGWNWYCDEAIKRNNKYLLNYAISNLVLFGGRLILAYNEMLYPYHKWFLKVVEKAKFKPENIMELIDAVFKKRDKESIETFYNSIINFTDWGISEFNWCNQFMADSELNWLNGQVPIADI